VTPGVYESDSVERTEAIAAELAHSLVGGECIALEGELGAGKTQFVRGLVRGLGGNARAVSSPTFVLLNVYPRSSGGRLTVYHLDAYRIATAEDFEAIGFAELLEQGGVAIVEWASRVASLLPARRWNVAIEATDESHRVVRIQRMPEAPCALGMQLDGAKSPSP
jgi:tRNA threonylcarbamoyladenosine biosynthesis protein TsaE